jgi:hypothetical protein
MASPLLWFFQVYQTLAIAEHLLYIQESPTDLVGVLTTSEIIFLTTVGAIVGTSEVAVGRASNSCEKGVGASIVVGENTGVGITLFR